MKIYTIAKESNHCYGHGDFANRQEITRTGPYDTGDFPPCFVSLSNAQIYLNNLPYHSGKVIVELELFDS